MWPLWRHETVHMHLPTESTFSKATTTTLHDCYRGWPGHIFGSTMSGKHLFRRLTCERNAREITNGTRFLVKHTRVCWMQRYQIQPANVFLFLSFLQLLKISFREREVLVTSGRQPETPPSTDIRGLINNSRVKFPGKPLDEIEDWGTIGIVCAWCKHAIGYVWWVPHRQIAVNCSEL